MNPSVSDSKYFIMESSNQSVTHPTPLASQGYSHQLQPAIWSGNKVCQSNTNQNSNIDPYSQQMNHYYQAPYSTQNSNEMNRYLSTAQKDQNSNPVVYSSQYTVTKQNNYSCTNPSPNYHVAIKNNCSNLHYGNVNASKSYPLNSTVQPKKYASSSLGLSQAPQVVPQSTQVSQNTGTPMPQMPNVGDQNYMQNMYVNSCNVHTSGGNSQPFMMRQTMSSSSMLSSQENISIHSAAMAHVNQVSQMSSIPTPPETSSLPGDGIPMIDNTSPDGSADSVKMNISSASFVLPGSSINHLASSMPSPVSSLANNSTLSNRNTGATLHPPANLDEGSQASSASASSSIPDEQNSKTNSKPNFSYPPTPNTLSSPGAASMSSFHDDLECISSPGWPKTPASPVANSNYEFANIKRPENLLKLYTLSDEPDRRYFLDKLIVFNEDRGSPITQCPTISKQPLDVFRIYLTVKERGGFVEVTNTKRWKDIAGAIGVGASSSAAYTLRKQYMKLLLPFECKFDRGGIDPQPIINMVEASSRKKGKTAPPVAYGNPNPYNQGYSQVIDRYHSGYSTSYQSSRYPCNNIEYQNQTPMHYSQLVTHNTPPIAIPGQNQYNQYSHNAVSNYGYYQGNNSTSSSAYCNNSQNSANNNICRYGNNTTSSTVPHQQEQGYYTQQYSASQGPMVQENTYSSTRACSAQENLIPAVSNQIASDLEQTTQYPKVSSIINTISVTSSESNMSHQKPTSDSFGKMNVNCVSMNTSSFESCPENKSYCNNYVSNKASAVDQTPLINTSSEPTTPISQTYQQPVSESMINKTPDMKYYISSPVSHSTTNTYSNQNQNSYLNQNSYSNQKLHFQADYQPKEQVQSSQYGQYSEVQNESYRGSEGPPTVQVDRRSLQSGDNAANTTKSYVFNSNTQKHTPYNYSVQQAASKDVHNTSNYSTHFSSGSQRAWHPEQNQYSYQTHVGQRMPLKNPINSPAATQSPDTPCMRKPWLNSQETQPPSKPPSTLTSPVQNLIPPVTKPQPHPPSMTVSQAFQSMVKRPMEFPSNSVESVNPVAAKRRRCPAKRLGNIDPWRIMLALKSGLLAESTWALDTLAILLSDNNSVVYFGLSHLPGLLTVLVDHYRCFLNKIFHFANNAEIEQSQITKKSESYNDLSYLGFNVLSDLENKIKFLDTPDYTYKTRCKKKVEIQYDEALFLIDPQRSWDKYEGFDVSLEHWQKGGGDTTIHIQSCFDSYSKKIKFHRELCTEEKTKHKTNKVSVTVKSLRPVLGSKTNIIKSSNLNKGEPVVVLQKFNFLSNKISTSDVESDAEPDENNSLPSSNSSFKKPVENVTVKKEEFLDSYESVSTGFCKNIFKSVSSLSDDNALNSCDMDELKHQKLKIEETEESHDLQQNSDCETSENFPRLRGSLSSRKRFLCEDLEDESYCFDQPALCVISDAQEMLSRRCVCVSTILRNLSFVPGNDIVMGKNSGILLLLGQLLLLHHEHKPAKNAYRKYEKEIDGNVSWNESCISLKDDQEWWWGTLSVLRDNTLVILSNISGQLDLAPFPEEVSLPILDGLLHWIVCPSSYAQDPLPSRSPSSVLSPQRLSLEALCKLSVLSSNVDLIIATPPWSRIENLFAFLTKSLCHGQDQIMREFAVILLSNISQADSVAARTIAEQSHCISYLIAFIEEAEANAFQIAISQGTKKLRDKPELMGTTTGMVQRAACTLKSLALVPENQCLFVRYQARLLSLVMSQVIDQELAAVIADVLFYCSEVMGDITNQLSIS